MVRLGDLMDENKGKLNIEVAKKIIADHYDVYLKKEDNPCSRTVCSHYDLDAREYMSQADRPKPYSPHGAVDGIVCDTKLAKNMSFIGRFGNSCGTPFIANDFFKEHRQYEKFEPYIKDRLTEPWTEFTISSSSSSKKTKSKFKLTKKGRTMKNKTKKSKITDEE
jgi:hypothetical protein